MITQERLKELLNYDPETGVFTWKVQKSNSIKVDDVAGGISNNGYLTIQIDRKAYLLHRLVWLYMCGDFPETDLDHINGIKSDNRLANLRAVTDSQNNMNRGIPRNNNSGVKGVHLDSRTKKWKSYIKVDGITYHLGYFTSFEQATSMRRGAAALAFGEFAHAHDLS